MKIQSPWVIILAMMAGWLNRYQQDMIDYLREENKILREKVGSKRIILTDEQKRRLARLAKNVGHKALSQICGVFSPNTLLKWHRMLVARKYDGSKCRKYGRPQIAEELRKLIIKIARANRDWGYPRIQGQLKYIGYKVCTKTIANILRKKGLEPQPSRTRQITWKEFVKSHFESLVAIDFFSTEIYTLKGLTRYMVFIAIDYSTRKVEIVGIIEQAYGTWMQQMAKNLTDPISGFLKDKRYLIHDRDPLYTEEFIRILKAADVEPIRSMPMAPNFSPFVERFIRSIKSECLDRMLIFGERHLHYCIENYLLHYHRERTHQGIDNNIIDPLPQGDGKVICRERLGGLLKFYRRAA